MITKPRALSDRLIIVCQINEETNYYQQLHIGVFIDLTEPLSGCIKTDPFCAEKRSNLKNLVLHLNMDETKCANMLSILQQQ